MLVFFLNNFERIKYFALSLRLNLNWYFYAGQPRCFVNHPGGNFMFKVNNENLLRN